MYDFVSGFVPKSFMSYLEGKLGENLFCGRSTLIE